MTAFGVGLISLASGHRSTSKIIYNPSSSAPRGWYVVSPVVKLQRGDYALVHLPPAVADMADQRHYLPKTAPLLKNIGAVGGDWVCEQQRLVRINGAAVARALAHDRTGRALVAWADCRQLTSRELFLLGISGASFDSRYYGPIDAESVIGRAVPVWTW